MKYTKKDFDKDFPNEEACLDYIFKAKYPQASQYYRVRGRKCYAHSMTGKQIHPLGGTIFAKSRTPLSQWLYAIFLFATSKNGVSARELQRHLGVTYKTAWRIAHQIRKLMEQGKDPLSGTVEVDETYIGGKHHRRYGFSKKAAVMGMVEREGRVRAAHIPNRETHIVLNQITANVDRRSTIMSDEYSAYKKLPKFGYQSRRIKHGKGHYVRGIVHTNTIEGFWSQLKRSISGTYVWVSHRHLQSYVDEFVYRYNLRRSQVPLFQSLLGQVTR